MKVNYLIVIISVLLLNKLKAETTEIISVFEDGNVLLKNETNDHILLDSNFTKLFRFKGEVIDVGELMFVAKDFNNQYQLINSKGDKVLGRVFNKLYLICDSICLFETFEKRCLLNVNTGKEINVEVNCRASKGKANKFWLTQGNTSFLMSSKFDTITTMDNVEVEMLDNGCSLVLTNENKYLLLDENGGVLWSTKLEFVFPADSNSFIISTNLKLKLTRYGVWGINKEKIIPRKFKDIIFDNGYYYCSLDNGGICYNKSGKKIFKTKYYDIQGGVNGNVFVVDLLDKGVSFALVNKSDSQISKKYLRINSFYNGYAIVKNFDYLFNYINIEGEQLFSFSFNSLTDFNYGFAYGVSHDRGNLIRINKYGVASRSIYLKNVWKN